MMVITEDRKQVLHLTDPFQENEYGLLVDAKSAFTKTGDLKQRTISYDGMPFNGRLLREHFPGAVHLRKPALADAVRSLCIGEAQAVFVQHITAVALLLSGPPCPGTSLRMLPIPTIRTEIGIGATRGSRAAADAIREEIGVMADDGSLQKILGAWRYTSGQELASLVALQHAKSHLWWYRLGFVAVGGLFVFASWSAAGYRRQRMKSQAYCRALGQAERNVRLVTDSLSEMVVAYDTDKKLTYANSGAEKLTGYGLGELQVAPLLSWTYPEDRPNVLALWDKVFDGQMVDQVVHRLITKDGTVKWVVGSWGPVNDEAGRHIGIRGTCQDVTRGVVAEQMLAETTQKFRTIVEEIAERKRAEQALRESEQRFRAIFSQAAVGIAQTGIDGQWLLLNDRFCEMLGYSQAELIGKTFLDITHADDRGASLTAIRRLLAGEISSWSAEKRYIRKDGATMWARKLMSLVRDQDNRPQYFVAVVEDITDRVEAARALRDSERRLALAQSAAHLGQWDWDLRTNVHAVSGEYLRLYGLPADHPSPTHEEWLRLVHPHDRKRVQAALQECIERTHVWDTEFRVAWPDGSIHWLLGKGSVFLDDSGQPVRMAGVNLDITERKQAEEVRSHLADIVESSNDAIISKTLDGVIMSWNPGAERIYGYKAEEIVGLPISSLVPPDRPDEIPPIVERLRHGERLEQYETTRVRKDGRRIEVSVTISPIRDSTGAVLGASVIARDITEQKRAEAMLRRNLDEIAHLNRVAAMGELTASLAHELNQPLAAILSNAQAAGRFLGGESPDLVQVRECLTDIVADDKRAAEVIRRLRGLLKKEAAQRSSVDLNEVVSEAIRLLRNDAMLRNVSVKVEPFAGLPPVLGDRIQLYQVALNLIVNGVDAVAERPPENRWVLVRTAASHGGGVELTVEDSGKGIADGDLSRVFEPFFSTKQEGLGMGLSICRSIVEAHGGRIWAERRAGPGAVFRCLLPVAQRATAASAK